MPLRAVATAAFRWTYGGTAVVLMPLSRLRRIPRIHSKDSFQGFIPRRSRKKDRGLREDIGLGGREPWRGPWRRPWRLLDAPRRHSSQTFTYSRVWMDKPGASSSFEDRPWVLRQTEDLLSTVGDATVGDAIVGDGEELRKAWSPRVYLLLAIGGYT